MSDALLDIPTKVRAGEIFTVKVVLSHIMETGYRRDISGKVIPRNIIKWFSCFYGGEEVFRCDMTQAIAANPFLAFTTIATQSGPLVMRWADDEGTAYKEEVMIEVSG